MIKEAILKRRYAQDLEKQATRIRENADTQAKALEDRARQLHYEADKLEQPTLHRPALPAPRR